MPRYYYYYYYYYNQSILVEQNNPTLQIHRTISWCLTLTVTAFIAIAVAYILLGIDWRLYYHISYLLICFARLIIINEVLLVSVW